MRGRKPTPTQLHALHGNPRKLSRSARAARRAVEGKQSADPLAPPEDLTDAQREIWADAIASAPPGILRRIDTQVLVAWVIACDLHRQARVLQQTVGLVGRIGPAPPEGKPDNRPITQSPYLPIINRQAVMMLRAAELLGFTPTSRPRLAGASSPLPLPPRVTDNKPEMSLDDYIRSAPPIPTFPPEGRGH